MIVSKGIMNLMKCRRKSTHQTKQKADAEALRLTQRSEEAGYCHVFAAYKCTRGKACRMWHVATVENIKAYRSGK